MQEHSSDSASAVSPNISNRAVQLCSWLAFFGTYLASDTLCTLIWRHLHPPRVHGRPWFGALAIAIMAASALIAIVTTARVARASRMIAVTDVVGGVASGVLTFSLYQLLPR